MANIVGTDDELNKQIQAGMTASDITQPISLSGAGGSPLSGGISATASTGTQASADTNGNGNGGTGGQTTPAPVFNPSFASASNMAAANGPANYNFIGDNLQKQNSSIYDLMNKAYADYQTAAGSAPVFNKQTVDKAVQTGDAAQMKNVADWMTTSYKGPQSWDTSSFTPGLTNYANNLGQLKDSGGLFNWLVSNIDGETPGAAQMDASQIWNDPGYNKSWDNWNQGLTNLNTTKTNNDTSAQKLYDSLIKGYGDLNTNTNKYVNQSANDYMAGFNNIVAQNQKSNAGVYADYLRKAALPDTEYRIRKGDFYDTTHYADPTLNNSITSDQVKPYNNLESLLGGTQLTPSGGWQANRVIFDQHGLDQAVANKKAEMNQAIQAEATRLGYQNALSAEAAAQKAKNDALASQTNYVRNTYVPPPPTPVYVPPPLPTVNISQPYTMGLWHL